MRLNEQYQNYKEQISFEFLKVHEQMNTNPFHESNNSFKTQEAIVKANQFAVGHIKEC